MGEDDQHDQNHWVFALIELVRKRLANLPGGAGVETGLLESRPLKCPSGAVSIMTDLAKRMAQSFSVSA